MLQRLLSGSALALCAAVVLLIGGSDYGLKYATIVAGAQRANTEAMAYGAPANAAGTTTYALEISGANTDGGTSIGRGVGGLALFAAGAGLIVYRRMVSGRA